MMDLSTLESWLGKAACSVRGELSAHEYKDYILPLVFYKRLDDVYSDEVRDIGIPVDLADTLSHPHYDWTPEQEAD